MKQLKYFNHCKSLDEIKSEYKKHVLQWLPTAERAGEADLLALLDTEYNEISQRPNFKKNSPEVQAEFTVFPKIVKELVTIGLDMEMCGSWLWVSGNTFDHTEKLKELGLKYSPNKKMWYYRPKWSRSTNSSPMSFDYIRNKYGSDKIEKEFAFDQQQGGGLQV